MVATTPLKSGKPLPPPSPANTKNIVKTSKPLPPPPGKNIPVPPRPLPPPPGKNIPAPPKDYDAADMLHKKYVDAHNRDIKAMHSGAFDRVDIHIHDWSMDLKARKPGMGKNEYAVEKAQLRKVQIERDRYEASFRAEGGNWSAKEAAKVDKALMKKIPGPIKSKVSSLYGKTQDKMGVMWERATRPGAPTNLMRGVMTVGVLAGVGMLGWGLFFGFPKWISDILPEDSPILTFADWIDEYKWLLLIALLALVSAYVYFVIWKPKQVIMEAI